MKARTVIATALLAATLGATTAAAASALHWGPRVGLNASAFTGEFGELIETDLRWFPNLGVALQVDLAQNVAFRGEVAYAVKGGGGESEGVDAGGNVISRTKDTWRFSYVEIPLMVRTRMPLGVRATPWLELGPAFSFAVAGEFDSDGSGLPASDLKGDMNTFDMGFGGGFGIEMPAGAGRASLEVRYLRGFSEVFKGDALTVNNQAWTFAVAWLR